MQVRLQIISRSKAAVQPPANAPTRLHAVVMARFCGPGWAISRVAQSLLEAINVTAHALESACRQSGKRSSHSEEIHPHACSSCFLLSTTECVRCRHPTACRPLKPPCKQTMLARWPMARPKAAAAAKHALAPNRLRRKPMAFTPPNCRADQTRDGKPGGRGVGANTRAGPPSPSHIAAPEARGAGARAGRDKATAFPSLRAEAVS
jgi:hypothetical protein